MILWQIRRRAANQLLTLLVRHRLMRELLNARRQHALSVPEINHLSREAWLHFFGDSADGFDQYVWASKPHFFRLHVFFYDWQYTFGYLVSQMLARTFEHDGATKAGADITSDAFWDDAVCEALSYACRV
ncbi:MAG: hypothetical protein J6K46_03345 [Sutterella sp.]|nr:hypothetical protein [Sutterella sp.]